MKINKKGDNMNNFKKVGLSALAGSLAAMTRRPILTFSMLSIGTEPTSLGIGIGAK